MGQRLHSIHLDTWMRMCVQVIDEAADLAGHECMHIRRYLLSELFVFAVFNFAVKLRAAFNHPCWLHPCWLHQVRLQ